VSMPSQWAFTKMGVMTVASMSASALPRSALDAALLACRHPSAEMPHLA